MAFRFRKSFSLIPGVRVNLSKSGISTSIGPRGASVNVGRKGVHINTGLPGTGLSQRTKLDAPAASGNWLKRLVWLNVIGWGGLFLLGALFHWLTSGQRKWKHPVMVIGTGVRVRGSTNTQAAIVTTVSTGDTLELTELNYSGDWCRVQPRADRPDFPNDQLGYVRRSLLTIPDSTLKRAASKRGLY